MTERTTTQTAPAELRGGTYEREGIATALLWHRTHAMHDLPRTRKVTTIGAAADRDIEITGKHISAEHCRIERRARGMVLTDEGSKNGTYHETKRSFGLGLKPSFEETRVGSRGVLLVPGTTFVVGDMPHRYIAIDDAMRRDHPALLDILGTEDEVQESQELVSPSDLILAADTAGHMLITGEPGCDQEELARIVHRISKRRRRRLVECDRVPDDKEAQGVLLKEEAVKATLLLNLGDSSEPIASIFVSSLFSSAYQIRVIVLARTVGVASAALGAAYVQPMMHVGLRPLAARRTAILPLLDRWLAARGSPLRVADLTPENRHALLVHDWRENLVKLRETAERLDAIIRAPDFSLNQARKALGVARNTFYSWFSSTLRLSLPLVPDERARALQAALRAQRPASEQ